MNISQTSHKNKNTTQKIKNQSTCTWKSLDSVRLKTCNAVSYCGLRTYAIVSSVGKLIAIEAVKGIRNTAHGVCDTAIS